MGKLSTNNPPRKRRLPRALAILAALLCAFLVKPAPSQTSPSTSALTVPLLLPSAIAFDSQGNLYLAESGNHVIRKIDTTGHITTIAGTGIQGFSGDAGPATSAQLDSPQGLALTSHTLFIADTHNHRIRSLDLTTGIITTIAGNGIPSYSGDSAIATTASLNLPTALAVDSTGNLYFADTGNHRIRKINATTSVITTIAGIGTQGYSGDGALATQASIDSPTGLAIDTLGNIYLADTHNHRIRKIAAATGIISTIAGNGTLGFSGDGSSSTASSLALPNGLTLDATGNLYLADTENHRIRRIDTSTGLITTVAGTGTQLFSGDSSQATSATLNSPRTVTISPPGLLTLADTGNQRIRQRTAEGTITTIAGLGLIQPSTLTLTAPAVITYGTGNLTAQLNSTTPATGAITFFDSTSASPVTIGTATLVAKSASISTSTVPAGLHTFIAVFSGDLTHASAQAPATSLTINQAPATTTLTIPTQNPTAGSPIILSARTLSSTTGQPTGTITFLDGTSPILATPIDATGAASATTTSLTAGSHTLTAAYSGDNNFLASASTPAIITVGATSSAPQDFTLTTTGPATQTISSGTPATFNFAVQTNGPALSGPITLSVSGLPPAATASFNPAYIPPGTPSTALTLTITTPKTTASTLPRRIIFALLFLPMLSLTSRKSRPTVLITLFASLLCLGCGARINTNGESTHPVQTYTVTVTGTATTTTGATLQHTATITLQLQ